MKKKIKTAIATVTEKDEFISTARELLSRASQALRQFFRDHGEQIGQDPGYAAAFIAVVAAPVELVPKSEHVRYMAHKLADAYIALDPAAASSLARRLRRHRRRLGLTHHRSQPNTSHISP